jgi:hypothetical protein
VDNILETVMATADIGKLVNDIFADGTDEWHRKPYQPEDREAEAAKIVRLRQLRLARNAGSHPAQKPRRGLIVTR